MQIEFKLKRFLPVLLGLTLLWGMFIIANFILKERANPNEQYIPENNVFVASFDGKSFFESAVYDLFFSSKDNEIFKQLQSLSQEEKDVEIRDAGIDFLSDVIVFGQEDYHGRYIGFLFNLTDAAKFNQNAATFISDNQSFASNDEVGILLTWTVDPTANIALPDLKAKAQQFLATKNKLQKRHLPASVPNSFMTLETSESSKNGIGKGFLNTWIDGSLFAFKGEFQQKKINASDWSLKPAGLHLTNRIFTQEIQDSIGKSLSAMGFSLPDICGLSLNYYGLTVLENGVAPKMDALFEFESDLDPQKIYERIENNDSTGFESMRTAQGDLIVKGDNFSYVIRILNKRTLFIGLDPKILLDKPDLHLFHLTGDLTKITQVSGGGLMSFGLMMIPAYKASRQLFEAVEVADISIAPANGKLLADGKIEFRKGKYPISEMLRFLLTIQILG